jgi:hypothetical protein
MRLSLAIANCCIADVSDFNWIHQNNDTFKADLEDLIRASYTFVILRDPYARLASCFLDKIVSQAKSAHRLRELANQNLDLDEITFAGFVNMLEDAGVRGDNMHWRPQTEFLVYDCYDDYFAMEDFVHAMAAIQDRAGLEIMDARQLTAHGLDRYSLLPEDIDHSRTPAREIALLKRDGHCPHPRSLFTPPIIASVSHYYADDLQLYADRIGLPLLFPRAHQRNSRCTNDRPGERNLYVVAGKRP